MIDWITSLGIEPKIMAAIGAAIVLAFSTPIQNWPAALKGMLGGVLQKTGLPPALADKVVLAADNAADIIAYLQLQDRLAAVGCDKLVWQSILPGTPAPVIPAPTIVAAAPLSQLAAQVAANPAPQQGATP